MKKTVFGDSNICKYETIMFLKNGEIYYVYSNELPQTLGNVICVHADDGSKYGMNVSEFMNYIVKMEINSNV